MTVWFILATFLISIAYGLLPDDGQAALQWEVVQIQLVLMGLAAFSALQYRKPLDKGVILLASVWAVWIMATDWIIPASWPSWIEAVEGGIFAAWLLYLWARNAYLSRGEETGQPDGDDPVHPDGEGRGWGGDR